MKYLTYLPLLLLITQCSPSKKELKTSQIELTNSQQDKPAVLLAEKLEKRTFTVDDSTCVKELINACEKNNLKKAKFLVQSGCNVNGKIRTGHHSWTSPLRAGVHHNDSKIAELLINAGADPELDLGNTSKPTSFAAGFNTNTLKLLIENGGNVNSFNNYKVYQTPLIWAIFRGHLENVKLLIEHGVPINYDSIAAKHYEQTPLHTSIFRGELEITKYLLEQGANPNSKITEEAGDCVVCPVGIAPIHTVSASQNIEFSKKVIDLLIEFKADLNIRNAQNLNALSHMAPDGQGQIADYLIQKGIIISDIAVVRAAMHQNEEVLKVLLDNGANPNANGYGRSALSSAFPCCGDGLNDNPILYRIKTLEILLENGAQPSEVFINSIKKREPSDTLRRTFEKYGY